MGSNCLSFLMFLASHKRRINNYVFTLHNYRLNKLKLKLNVYIYTSMECVYISSRVYQKHSYSIVVVRDSLNNMRLV